MTEILRVFFFIFCINLTCSCIPFLTFGLLFGFPSVVLSSVFLTLFYFAYSKDQKGKNEKVN